jgi:pimeloyl-ACP methyl ester carboxylesterase
MKDVDLGVCGGQLFPADPLRVGILLPGARYVPAAPLLWFTREVLQSENWTVLQVWDEWDRSSDAGQWVAERFDAALQFVGPEANLLVVAKSITSLALPSAAERGLPGVWLTPLLNLPEVRSGLKAVTAPTLLAGGTADPTWDSEFVAALEGPDVLEIEGADHGLQHSGDPLRSLDALRTLVQGVRGFVGRLG